MTADQKDTDVSPELMQKLANAIAQGFADQIPSKMLSNENGQGVISITKDCEWTINPHKIVEAAIDALHDAGYRIVREN
jgi:hypothetical protein